MAWSCEGGRSTVLRSGWTDEDHFVIGEGDAASFGGMLFYGLIAASFKKGLGGHRCTLSFGGLRIPIYRRSRRRCQDEDDLCG